MRIFRSRFLHEQIIFGLLIWGLEKMDILLKHWIGAVCLYWTALKTQLAIYKLGDFLPVNYTPIFTPQTVGGFINNILAHQD